MCRNHWILAALIGLAATLIVVSRFTTGNTEESQCAFYDIEISVPPADIDRLRVDPRADVRCHCNIKSVGAFQAMVHLKGSGTFEEIDRRPNFTIKPITGSLQARPAGAFLDRRFYLHNSNHDPSLLRDFIGHEIFRRCGVPAPQVAHAFVRLNGRRLGTYSLAQPLSKRFINSALGTQGGELQENEHRECPSFSTRLEGEVESPLIATNPASFDAENLAAYVTSEYLCAIEDGYLFNLNNYWVYQHPMSHQLYLFPHTLDGSFRLSRAFVTMRTSAGAAKAMFRDNTRNTLLERLRDASSAASQHSLLQLVEERGSNLVNEIVKRDPDRALSRCAAIQALKAEMQSHFQMVAQAVELELQGEQRSSIGLPIAEWLLVDGAPGCTLTRDSTDGLLHLVSRSATNHAALKSGSFLAKGQYDLRLFMHVQGAWQKPTDSPRAMVSIGQNELVQCELRPGWNEINARFEVVGKDDPRRLFHCEPVSVRIDLRAPSPRLTIDLRRSGVLTARCLPISGG